jgi:hypothetical protein
MLHLVSVQPTVTVEHALFLLPQKSRATSTVLTRGSFNDATIETSIRSVLFSTIMANYKLSDQHHPSFPSRYLLAQTKLPDL